MPNPDDFVITLHQPAWIHEHLANLPGQVADDTERMALAIELARLNTEHGTGGPFGAAVFESSGRLVAVGVNVVVPDSCSFAHAEMTALGAAQQRLKTYDLGAEGLPQHELVTSTEPCAMCMGAVPWSGVRRLVCGARDEDARAVGFDEGPKIAEWPKELQARGIAVVRDVLRDEAAGVLRGYADGGGRIYNSREG